MRYSQSFIPTVKEVPADAECLSHRLMVRAGLIRKVASGTYTYLPLGWRSLLKIIAIVRDEMNRAGALEIMVPSMQPKELWDKTGRSADYGPTMFCLQDRHGRMNVLGPTAEEVFTTLVAGEVKSYKQLPINLYQISPKFRDEFRPRFGPVRSREFIMKDAYSFDETPEGLHKSYTAMYDAYCRVFKRCGLEYVIVEAESGEMGGSGSHQFTIPCESGEDTIVYTEDGSYAANLEKAAVDPISPAVIPSEVVGRGSPRQYLAPTPAVGGIPRPVNLPAPEEVHTPNIGTIEAVCEFLRSKPKDMIKTLIYAAGEDVIAALVRGDHDVNPEKLTQTLAGRHAELADEQTIKRVTGAKVGFAGPIRIVDSVSKLIIDHAIAAMAAGIAGANKTDYHIRNVVPGRDFPLEGERVIVADIRYACEGDTHNGKKLLFKKGIEVGQVFKLGTKYSVKLGAKFLDEQGAEKPCLMGCYGIGINRILASAIELGNDQNGIIWPISIAPYEVLVTCVNQDDKAVAGAAENIYRQLLDAGVEVLYDDRDLRGGPKFKDADLLGIPVRVTVGQKSLADGSVELKLRRESQSRKVAVDQAAGKTVELVNSLKEELSA